MIPGRLERLLSNADRFLLSPFPDGSLGRGIGGTSIENPSFVNFSLWYTCFHREGIYVPHHCVHRCWLVFAAHAGHLKFRTINLRESKCCFVDADLR